MHNMHAFSLWCVNFNVFRDDFHQEQDNFFGQLQEEDEINIPATKFLAFCSFIFLFGGIIWGILIRFINYKQMGSKFSGNGIMAHQLLLAGSALIYKFCKELGTTPEDQERMRSQQAQLNLERELAYE